MISAASGNSDRRIAAWVKFDELDGNTLVNVPSLLREYNQTPKSTTLEAMASAMLGFVKLRAERAPGEALDELP